MKVLDQIVQNPKFMLVGEAPGEDEAMVGKPFVGRAGQQLDKLLSASKINREECYITNVTDERPPNNNFGIYYKDSSRREPTESLRQCWRSLQEKVERVQPKLLITFGNESLRAITGMQEITSRRGSIYYYQNIKVIPTIHPSAIIRGGGTSHWYLPAVMSDLERARDEVESQEPPTEVQCHLVSSPDFLNQYFTIIQQQQRQCTFDIETTEKGGGRIRCIGFASDIEHGYVVPFESIENGLEGEYLWDVIKKWMGGTGIQWIAQNGYGFDLNYLKSKKKFDVGNYAFDTMVAHHVLHPELPHDLGFLTSMYTRIPYYKDQSSVDLYKYNAQDAVATYIVAKELAKELHTRGLWSLYRDYYHPLITPLREMSFRGIRIDKEYQKELKEILKNEIEGLQVELDKSYTGHTNTDHIRRTIVRARLLQNGERKSILRIPLKRTKKGKCSRRQIPAYIKQLKKLLKKKESLNVRSTPDMVNFLYGVLGLPIQKKHRKVTTDETALNKLYIRTQHPFLKTIIKLRKVRKEMSDYGKMRTDPDGKVRTTYSFAETGRLRSGKFEAK